MNNEWHQSRLARGKEYIVYSRFQDAQLWPKGKKTLAKPMKQYAVKHGEEGIGEILFSR